MRIAIYLEDEPSAFGCEVKGENKIKDFSPTPNQVKRFCELVKMEVILCRTKTEFLKALPDVEIVVVWGFTTEELLRAKNIRVVATPAAGREGINLQKANRHIEIYHGRFHGALIAQTVVGALLALNRGLFRAQGQYWPRTSLHVNDIEGSNAVILGYGAIGRAIGDKLKCFGVNVYGVRRHKASGTYTLDDLPHLLPSCNHFILALPSDTGTDLLVNASMLALLPSHACLYNVGRGNVLDEYALCNALTSGKLAGAYLDVFAQEPLPATSPLYSIPNLLLTPHASAFGATYLDRFFAEFAQYLNSQFPQHD